jgi:integrase/recombinase XerD
MSTLPSIKLAKAVHRKQEVVLLKFAYNRHLIDTLKQIEVSRWSQIKSCWYIPLALFDLNVFLEIFRGKARVDYSTLKTSVWEKLDEHPKREKKAPISRISIPPAYIDLLDQKRYSESTKATYSSYFLDFMLFFKERDLANVKVEEINAYLLDLIRQRKISASQQNQRINAIKFYFEKVLGREKMYFDIQRPKKQKQLPDVLSKKEVKQIILNTNNLKHKCLIVLIYSCGLRRSEAINLKIADIDSSRMLIKIRGGKGHKDRYVQLADSLLKILRAYYREYKPKIYIFEGQNSEQYSSTSISNVIKNAAKKAGIKKRVFPHILRHSFATHHLEQGTDLRYIQEWMGHNSSKTTEIYTHISEKDFKKFNNPIDDFDL